MKPWPIKLVEQKGKTCTIACLAMILGESFDKVERDFLAPEEGTLVKTADYLGNHGYSVMIKELMFHSHPSFAREEIIKPFAPAHIVHCKQFADDPVQHVVVMDQNGKVFNPAGPNGRDLEKDYFMITGVLGIWRPVDL